MVRFYVILLITTSLLTNCTDEPAPEDHTIPHETFIKLYIDLLIAGESGFLSSSDSLKAQPAKKTIDSLYTHYGVTERQVRQTIEAYNRNLNQWKEFYEEVTKRLETMQREERERRRI